MANKDSKKPGVKASLRAAASGGISKSEIKQIQKDTGVALNKIVQRLDSVNQTLKANDKETIALNSGAANMLIKDAGKAPSWNQTNFGTGNIGKALSQAVGTPGYTAPRNPQSGGPYGGSTNAVAGTGYIPGGMQIRSGGRLAVRPQTVAAAPTTTTTTTPDATANTGMSPEDIQKLIDEGITAGINDYTTGLETAYNQQDQAYLDMLNNMSSMFSQQMQGMFDPLQQAISSLSAQEPMRLYGAGENYNVGGVRSQLRKPTSRPNYLRGNMSIGSNASPGLSSNISGLAGALGTLGGLTI